MGFSRQEYWSGLPYPSPGGSSQPKDWIRVSYIASCWDLVAWPGIELGLPALGTWSLSHWTTRKVPRQAFYILMLVLSYGLNLSIVDVWSQIIFCSGGHPAHRGMSSSIPAPHLPCPVAFFQPKMCLDIAQWPRELEPLCVITPMMGGGAGPFLVPTPTLTPPHRPHCLSLLHSLTSFIHCERKD